MLQKGGAEKIGQQLAGPMVEERKGTLTRSQGKGRE